MDYEATLVAGGGSAADATEIGIVQLVLDENGTLTVTYDASHSEGDSRDDWNLDEIHFDFGANLSLDIPVNRGGSPQIGLFDFGGCDNVRFIDTGEPSVVKFEIDGVCPEQLANWAAHATVSQKGAVEAFNESLPDRVSLRIVDYPSSGDSSYFKTEISGSSEEWLNGTHDGWCVDVDRTISLNTDYTANVYSSIGDDLTGIVDKPSNMDRVNWLLNNKDLLVGQEIFDSVVYKGGSSASGWSKDYSNGGAALDGDVLTGTGTSLGIITYADIQRAIWGLIDNTSSTNGLTGLSHARADELADRAFIWGEAYRPGCNDKAAVLFEPINQKGVPSNQVTIAQVTIISPNGTCDGREETAWAITGGIGGLGGENMFGKSWAEYNTTMPA
jgi:hypothetical protein